MAAYKDALLEEILAAPRLKVRSIFLGGGTPSYLPQEWMQAVMDALRERFDWEDGIEVTMEANPGHERLHDSSDTSAWAAYRLMGINRISLGVQSFDDGLLETLGRIHRSGDVTRAVAAFQQAGFTNGSIDLMYGLPGQTLAQWRTTLERAIALGVPHLSAYSLIVEPHTPFEAWQRQGRLHLPTDELEQEMAGLAHDMLTAQGYCQYEISNWALPGHESRHNQVYWFNEPWLGLGSGAHSYLNRIRWSNPATITQYVQAIQAGDPPKQPAPQSVDEEMEDVMFLGLRMTREGVSTSRFAQRFGIELQTRYGSVIARYIDRGLLEWRGEHLVLSPAGLPLANEVFTAFLTD